MFCPLEVTWGNAADWAAAIGSIVAVIAAVWIANGQKRFARWQKGEAERAERERHQSLINEVIRVTEQLRKEFEKLSKAGAMSGLQSIGADKWTNVERLRLRVKSLQSLATDFPRLFSEIGAILHNSYSDPTVTSPTGVRLICKGRADSLDQSLAELNDLLEQRRV